VNRSVTSAAWAWLIVAASLVLAYAFDAVGFQGLARVALAPIYPTLLAIIAVAGGFHETSGESFWMILAAVLAGFAWWGVIDLGRVVRRHRAARRRPSPPPPATGVRGV